MKLLKKKVNVVSVFLLPVLFTSCATHQFMRGTVAMKTNEKTAHICLGNKDVKVGDKVRFYNNNCRNVGGHEGDINTPCEMKELGTGVVTKLLNDHYSEVQTSRNFKFKEGTLVQKM